MMFIHYSQARFQNWEDFVNHTYSSDFKIVSNSAFLLVGFNSWSMIRNVLKSLDLSKVDVWIVDNCSSSPFILEDDSKDLNIVRALSNLGGAGGYALGLEAILRYEKYEKIIISEDDALGCSQNLLNLLLESSDSFDRVTTRYLDTGLSSFTFHFTRYSRQLILRSGVPDPRLFMRADDYEFALRLETVLANKKYKTQIVENSCYRHPTTKVINSLWGEFFGFRNMLYVTNAYNKFGKYFFEILKKSFYVSQRILFHADCSSLTIALSASKQFSSSKFNYFENLEALNKYKSIEPKFLPLVTIDELPRVADNHNTVKIGNGFPLGEHFSGYPTGVVFTGNLGFWIWLQAILPIYYIVDSNGPKEYKILRVKNTLFWMHLILLPITAILGIILTLFSFFRLLISTSNIINSK